MSLLKEEKRKFHDSIPQIERENNIKILLAYVRGSQMYGTATEASDVDISFIYQQSTDAILRGDYIPYIDIDSQGNVVGYEIQRYIELLTLNNPNILESLDIPEDCLIYQHESIQDVFHSADWLSKLTEKTFLGYADSQIKKATGLKKHMNRSDVGKKDLIDFCYIVSGVESKPLRDWIEEKRKDLSIEDIEKSSGLVKIPNGKGLYGLYIDVFENQNFRGIVKDSESTQLRTSSIPKEYMEVPYLMWYNQDGYEVWKKEYASYQKWSTERNEERFKMNQSHGKNYDSKNMMHLFRLLEMAFTIATEKKIQTRAEDVEWLQEIREGKLDYDELIQNAEFLFAEIKQMFEISNLQESPSIELGKQLLLKFRKYD